MALGQNELNILHLRKLATPNRKYYGDDERVYIGTLDGRLRLLDSAKNTTFNSSLIIESNNVQSAIEEISDNINGNAQDAVGSILVDTATIDLTYDNITPKITADLKDTTVTPGTYGNTTNVPQITIDQQGRITNATNIGISGITPNKEVEVDFGTTSYQTYKIFNIVDVSILPSSNILVSKSIKQPSDGRSIDEIFAETLDISAKANTGNFDLYVKSEVGTVSGKFIINYSI